MDEAKNEWIPGAYAIDGNGRAWRCEDLRGDNAVWVAITPREWAEMRCATVVECFPPGARVCFTDIYFREAIGEVMAERYPERQYAFVGKIGSWLGEVADNNLAEIFATWDD